MRKNKSIFRGGKKLFLSVWNYKRNIQKRITNHEFRKKSQTLFRKFKIYKCYSFEIFQLNYV